MFPKLIDLWLLQRVQLCEAGVGAAPLFPSSWGTQMGPRAGLFHQELKFSDLHFCKRDRGKTHFK